MNYIDTVLIVCMGIGLLAGGYSLARSPSAYFDFAAELIRRITPILAKPEDPEVQKKRIEVQRRGGEWDHFNKRERERNK